MPLEILEANRDIAAELAVPVHAMLAVQGSAAYPQQESKKAMAIAEKRSETNQPTGESGFGGLAPDFLLYLCHR
jgi:hypothetical protein